MTQTEVLETATKKRIGRPPKSVAETAPAGSASFWETQKKIPDDEWGPRALIYLYRIEPRIDKGGSKHYIQVYKEPINEDKILMDHGSGKYSVLLNYRKPGETNGKAIDSTTVAVNNIKFPPKVQPGDWVDSPENKSWEWVKATFPKPPGEGGTLLEAVRVVGEIQNAAKASTQEREPQPPPRNPVVDTVETIKAVKELMPPPAPPSTENQTLQSIVALMIAQAERSQKQSDTLLSMLLAQMTKQQQQPVADGRTSMKELVALFKDDVLPLIEKLKPSETIDAITRRSKMNGWQEMLQPAIPVVVDFLKPFAAGLATSLFTRAGQPATPQGMNGAQPPSAAPSLAPGSQNGTMPPLLNMIAPAMLNYMRVEADPHELGEDFASWVHEGFEADPRFNSAIAMARTAGPNVIIAQFKGSPWWLDKGAANDQPSLAEMEGKFGIFTQAFLNWRPRENESFDSPDVIDIG